MWEKRIEKVTVSVQICFLKKKKKKKKMISTYSLCSLT